MKSRVLNRQDNRYKIYQMNTMIERNKQKLNYRKKNNKNKNK